MKKVGLCLLFFGLLGCGREIPEGFAPVTVRLGRETQKPSWVDGFQLGALAVDPIKVCKGDRVDILVMGPGIIPEIRISLTGELSAAPIDANATDYGSFERKMLVPKGLDRTFMVSGQVTVGDCIGGFKTPVGGFSQVAIDGPMLVNLNGLIASSGYSLSDAAPINSYFSKSQFVGLKLIVGFSFPSIGQIRIKNLADDLPDSVVPYSSSIPSGGSVFLYPLVPFRKYQIAFVESGTPARVVSTVTRSPIERIQEVRVPAVTVGAAGH